MIEIKSLQQLKRIRRLVLSAQGLIKANTYGRGLDGVRSAINNLGYVQLDSISVIQRAHHHVLYSRVPGYQPNMIEKLMQGGDVFEYWAHAAALLPIADFRYSLPYKQAIKSGQTHWYKNPDKKLMKELMGRIKSDGPLRSRDVKIQADKDTKNSGWWDWKPAKKALEQLYMQGDLMVSERIGFQKTYDLTERVIPSQVDSSMPNVDELARYLLNQQLRSYGLVSLKGITYLRRNVELKRMVKSLVSEMLSQGTLQQIQLPNESIYLIETGALENSMPRLNNTLRILSPFDNSVIQRNRLKEVFDFDYQLECYVPAIKRQYGYFSLPLLYQGEFIGRMDCKAHRKESHLEIKALHFEASFMDKNFDQDSLINSLVKALVEFRDFQQCDRFSQTQIRPKSMNKPLQCALKRMLNN